MNRKNRRTRRQFRVRLPYWETFRRRLAAALALCAVSLVRPR